MTGRITLLRRYRDCYDFHIFTGVRTIPMHTCRFGCSVSAGNSPGRKSHYSRNTLTVPRGGVKQRQKFIAYIYIYIYSKVIITRTRTRGDNLRIISVSVFRINSKFISFERAIRKYSD